MQSTLGTLTSVFSRLGSASVDMNLEVWPNSQTESDYAQYVEGGLAVDSGPLGLVQQSGWYVPTQTVNDNWEAYFDFWKGYRYDNLTGYGFPAAGSTADSLKVGTGREFVPPWCVLETEPKGCVASYYNPDYLARRCNVTVYSPYCIEMYGIDAVEYDPGVVQQQIYNLHLNITLLFLGDANYHALLATLLSNNATFLAYDWTPSIETSSPSLSRVALPSYSDACWNGQQNNATIMDGIGGIACDFPSQAILKYYSASLSAGADYADALHFISLFNFANRYQQSLLGSMGNNTAAWADYANTGTCGWIKGYVKLWNTWISISPQPIIKQVPTAAWVPVVAIVGVLASFSLMLHIFLYRQRKHPLVMSSSPLFGQMIISGSWFLYVAVGVMAWKQVDGVCSVIPIFLCIAYTLVIGTLFAKTWRLNRIFHGASLKSVRVSAWDVLAFISLFFTFDFIINTAWLLIDRPVPELTHDSTNSLELIYVCQSQYYTLWYTILIVPKGLLLLYGAFLAYHVRHISQNFNESRYIALAILHFILFGVIVIPMDQALSSQLIVHYLLITLMLCLCIFVTLSLIFLPKIYAIVYKRKGKLRQMKEDVSKEEPHAGVGGVGHRWMREKAVQEDDSDSSGKLSFPSLSSGGFHHAMRLVRLVAESLYREHGIGEYWQFCVAVRNMSQAELEARAPLLVAYLQQLQTLQAQGGGGGGRSRDGGERGLSVLGGGAECEEEKVQADVGAMTVDEPVSQIPMVVASSFAPDKDGRSDVELTALSAHHPVDMLDTDDDPPHFTDDPPHLSHPITQASYSVSLSSSHSNRAAVDLPPLPADAWMIDAVQAAMVEKAVLDFAAAPLLSPVASHSPATTTALLLPRFSHTSPSQSSSLSSPLSFPLTVASLPRSQEGAASYASQASFSTSDVQGGGGGRGGGRGGVGGAGGSMSLPSLPSPMSSASSQHSPMSAPNHHSSTSVQSGHSGHSGHSSDRSGSGSRMEGDEREKMNEGQGGAAEGAEERMSEAHNRDRVM